MPYDPVYPIYSIHLKWVEDGEARNRDAGDEAQETLEF